MKEYTPKAKHTKKEKKSESEEYTLTETKKTPTKNPEEVKEESLKLRFIDAETGHPVENTHDLMITDGGEIYKYWRSGHHPIVAQPNIKVTFDV